jgi:uncharacterized tellurite resistance protein B-like protein
MEFILVIAIWWLFWWGIGHGITAIKKGTKGVIKTVKDGGDIVENVKNQFREMGAFEMKVEPIKVDISDRKADAYDVYIRGHFKLGYTTDISIATSLFDYTDEKFDAIISSIEGFREKNTDGYQSVVDLKGVTPNQGYLDWISVARFFPEITVGTKKGKRKIRVYARVIPTKSLSTINYGLMPTDSEVFSAAFKDVEVNLKEKGWRESIEEREEAKAIIIKLAVAVASEDGEMNAQEGKAIQAWIKQEISYAVDSRKEYIKNFLNSALKEAYKLETEKNNPQEPLIKRLKEINIGSINQSSMKLLMDVIGADNEITKSEMKLINSIGKELEINVKDIQAMTDKAFLEMKGGSELNETMDSMIVINPEWTKAEIKDYLNKEFTKWNGRIQALEDEEKKNKAQAMLDAIAKARKKYAK